MIPCRRGTTSLRSPLPPTRDFALLTSISRVSCTESRISFPRAWSWSREELLNCYQYMIHCAYCTTRRPRSWPPASARGPRFLWKAVAEPAGHLANSLHPNSLHLIFGRVWAHVDVRCWPLPSRPHNSSARKPGQLIASDSISWTNRDQPGLVKSSQRCLYGAPATKEISKDH